MFTTPFSQTVRPAAEIHSLHSVKPARQRARKPAPIAEFPVASATGTMLRSFGVFAAAPLPLLENLARGCMVRRVAPNTRVLRAGEPANFVYLVLSGSLNVLAGNEDGREAILAILKQGDLFGEMGVLDEQARCATVVAATPCVLITLSRSDFKAFMKDNFAVTEYIMRMLIGRLRSANRRIESLALSEVPARVVSALRDLAETECHDPHSARRHSIQEIAKMVGASREMVSRVMKDLIGRGEVVAVEGRYVPRGLLRPQPGSMAALPSRARRC